MSLSSVSTRMDHEQTDHRNGVALRAGGPWPCRPRVAEQARPCHGGRARCAEPARAPSDLLRQFRLALLRPWLLASGAPLPAFFRPARTYRNTAAVRRTAHRRERHGGSRVSRPTRIPRLRTALWLGMGADAFGRTGAARNPGGQGLERSVATVRGGLCTKI